MHYSKDPVKFDLSISSSVSPGQYLITWKKEESTSTPEYLDILNSILIVQEAKIAYASLSKPTFDLAEDFRYVYDQTATQVKLKVSQKPSDNLIVIIKAVTSGITISPNVVRFGSDSNEKAFTLTAKADPDPLVEFKFGTIKFELLGTNAKNYKLNRTSYTFDIVVTSSSADSSSSSGSTTASSTTTTKPKFVLDVSVTSTTTNEINFFV